MNLFRKLFGAKKSPNPRIAQDFGNKAPNSVQLPTSKGTATDPSATAIAKSPGMREKITILGKITAADEKGLRDVLTSGGNPNERDINGVPALALAAMRGDGACAQALVDFGADVDVTDSNGWTPLMHAVMQGKKTACVEVLLKAGAEIGIRLKSGIGLDTLANNSTPEIRIVVQKAFDEKTAAMLNQTLRLSGEITLLVQFELTRLCINIIENGSSRTSFALPGTRMTGLINKAITIEYADATATITGDVIEIIAGCCSDIEKQFQEVIAGGTWDPGNETFQLTELVPIIVNSLEPWTKPHLTFREVAISFAFPGTDE